MEGQNKIIWFCNGVLFKGLKNSENKHHKEIISFPHYLRRYAEISIKITAMLGIDVFIYKRNLS